MALDNEILRLDNLGIFPRDRESADDFVRRGAQVLSSGDDGEALLRDADSFRRDFGGNLYPVSKRTIGSAVDDIKRKFGCNFSWVRVYRGYMGDNWIQPCPSGICYAATEEVVDGVQVVIPPFIVIHTALPDFTSLKEVVKHELIHLPRYSTFHRDIVYASNTIFEERFAQSASWRQSLSAIVGFSPAINYEYFLVRYLMGREIGPTYNQVLMRMPYEEIRDFILDRNMSLKELIGIQTERGSLRYQIMKEGLRI